MGEGRQHVCRTRHRSTQPHLGDAAAYLEHAYDQVRRIIAILDLATAHARDYLTSIVGPAKPDQVAIVRRQLPEPITAAERGAGRKTHGRWIDSDGRVHKIVSGEDTLSTATRARLRSFGFPRLSVESHAEMKLAEYLRQRFEASGRSQHVTVVVNNDVCSGDLSCEELLPLMLPAGCTLTVYAPNDRRTFIGGATP
ncbi:MAG TPA: DddA-like double-stranded DNA deaminase toxin [Pseudonocardiaceae bacterium]|nr:DddA-like double-stranded DNA deaminase toxin [Pseudonocardiaceae bacterium]